MVSVSTWCEKYISYFNITQNSRKSKEKSKEISTKDVGTKTVSDLFGFFLKLNCSTSPRAICEHYEILFSSRKVRKYKLKLRFCRNCYFSTSTWATVTEDYHVRWHFCYLVYIFASTVICRTHHLHGSASLISHMKETKPQSSTSCIWIICWQLGLEEAESQLIIVRLILVFTWFSFCNNYAHRGKRFQPHNKHLFLN